MLKRVAVGAAAAMILLMVAIQLVPYGRDHANPPVTQEPAWANAQTRELAVRACYDCHSNETVWPWYTNVAPVSWLVQRDVNYGRQGLNFSRWDRPRQKTKHIAETVVEGTMPPWLYLPTHPKARLSDAEQQALIQGLQATFGGKAEGDGTQD